MSKHTVRFFSGAPFRITFFISLLLLLLNQSAFAVCYRLPDDSSAWWKLDETSGSTASDIVGSNHGTYVNGPTPTTGFVQGALNFNGTSQYVTVPNNDSLDFGTGDFSIEAWVNPNPAALAVRPIISKWASGMGPGYVLYWQNNNQISFVMNDSGGGPPIQGLTAPFVRTTWMHVAVTVDRNVSNGGKIYINGVAVASFNPTSRQGSMSNNDVVWMGRQANNWYNGKIDELTVYKKVLSASEILSIFQADAFGKCLPFSCATVQNYDRNLLKYWRYRNRFNSGFIVNGEQCGNGLPAADRGGWSWPAPEIHFGDAVNDMGYYISVLATEYKLLRNNGRSTNATEEQIYYALQELNRLDAYAESSWVEYLATGTLDFCQGPADMNGFMIRDDVPHNYVATYGAQLNAEVGRLYQISVNSTPRGVRPTEISQDHLFSLMTGLALVTKLVDTSTTYNGVNLVQETKDIVTRVLNWIKSYQWVITNPVRGLCVYGVSNTCWDNPPDPPNDPLGYQKCCSDGGAVTTPYSFGFAEAANKIVYGFTSGVSYGPFHDSISAQNQGTWIGSTLVWAPPTWHGENFILQLSAVGDSIHNLLGQNLTVPRLNLLSRKINREHIPLIHDVLYGHGHQIPNFLTSCLINSAPCSGPFGRLYGQTGPYEWATPNRFKIDPGERQDARVIDRCSEYYGLDYMMLYNLYRLVNAGGPFYEKLQLPPNASCDYCDSEGDAPSVDCDCLEAAGTVFTCKKSCSKHKRDCKEVCQSIKKVCKDDCKDDKEACMNDCDRLSGSARRDCRQTCRTNKRRCVRTCRSEKRDCKDECRDVFSDCKDICTSGTPADREQYCRDSVVRPAQGLYTCQ